MRSGWPGEQGFEFVVQAAAQLRADRAGRDGIGADAPLAELLGHVAGQHVQAALERGIRCDASGGHAGGRAGQVDDARALLHQRQQGLGQEERAFEVDAQQAVELRLGDGRDRVEQTVSGVIDQAFQGRRLPGRLQRLLHRFDKPAEGTDIAHVQFKRRCLAAVSMDTFHD